jgi:hypothetical protein
MTEEYDRNIRYWYVCLVQENAIVIERLKSFIGTRATYLTTEQDENRESWAVLDVHDHSILDELVFLDFVALTPTNDAFVVEAWPELDNLSPH